MTQNLLLGYLQRSWLYWLFFGHWCLNTPANGETFLPKKIPSFECTCKICRGSNEFVKKSRNMPLLPGKKNNKCSLSAQTMFCFGCLRRFSLNSNLFSEVSKNRADEPAKPANPTQLVSSMALHVR